MCMRTKKETKMEDVYTCILERDERVSGKFPTSLFVSFYFLITYELYSFQTPTKHTQNIMYTMYTKKHNMFLSNAHIVSISEALPYILS